MVKPHDHSAIKKTLGEDFNELLDEIAPFVGPRVDVYESDAHLMISADLAGVRKEDLSLKWKNSFLVLEGKIHNEHLKASYKKIRNERFYGSFKREVPVPRNCETGQILATLENGVLLITIPFRNDKDSR
ncbi:Hsp20/alpha crystallin family protein [Bacillus sp. FJAT-27251]|uniref:Hsp20/alpha crystallin family protein n=1 Tax=Bacillus sp. FJAT-27251 TaxID=1684142 RepID=UPI0006A7D3C8|nr:Hsp20/alpha crystallin family protein [Bacillus sp. FJAT-27251]